MLPQLGWDTRLFCAGHACCDRRPIPERLSHRRIALIAAAFGLAWREVIDDARVVWTWEGKADDLVVGVSKRHAWNAERSVGYLTALERVWQRKSGPSGPPP